MLLQGLVSDLWHIGCVNYHGRELF